VKKKKKQHSLHVVSGFFQASALLAGMADVLTLTVDGWSKAETGNHIVFVCTTKTTKTQWSTRRRYREFRALFDELKNEGPAKALKAKNQLTIPFPEKKLGTLGTHALESRRVLLQSFLQLVLGLYLTDVLSEETSNLFHDFIGLDNTEQGRPLDDMPELEQSMNISSQASTPVARNQEEDPEGAAMISRKRMLLEQKFKDGKISESELHSLLQTELLAEKLTSESTLHERSASRSNMLEAASPAPSKPAAAVASPLLTSLRAELAKRTHQVHSQEAELEAKSKAMVSLQVLPPHIIWSRVPPRPPPAPPRPAASLARPSLA
jgi:hypothetical protein